MQKEMKTELVQYVRNKRRQIMGVVLARLVLVGPAGKEIVALGWSKCCKKDRFDKDFGLVIARNRAECRAIEDRVSDTDIPQSLKNVYEKVLARAIKYFKDKEVKKNYV